jgi:hypothetical protein
VMQQHGIGHRRSGTLHAAQHAMRGDRVAGDVAPLLRAEFGRGCAQRPCAIARSTCREGARICG